MITLHKKKDHSKSDQLEEKLEDLVITFKTKVHDDGGSLPYIVEDGKVYKTKEEIEEWLNELSDELSRQRSISGDGCYIDPKKGKIT